MATPIAAASSSSSSSTGGTTGNLQSAPPSPPALPLLPNQQMERLRANYRLVENFPVTVNGVANIVFSYKYHCEDRAYCCMITGADGQPCLVVCVFDGHGGKDLSALALETLPPQIVKIVETYGTSQEAIKTPISAAIDEFGENAHASGKFKCMGCTSTIAVFTASRAHVWHAGDSRVEFYNAQYERVGYTVDHDWSIPEEAARIKSAGLLFNWGRAYDSDGNCGLNVARSFGDSFLKGGVVHTHDYKCVEYADIGAVCAVVGSDGWWGKSGYVAEEMVRITKEVFAPDRDELDTSDTDVYGLKCTKFVTAVSRRADCIGDDTTVVAVDLPTVFSSFSSSSSPSSSS
jgi:serine/threonine protein phosphatase PrpC